mmetsp:Transcript_24640/g.46875  ORF Transcript_24640/g.46875 Transcript_24640/m.46875 type:complete len:87 (+) Transcript_24640:2131-2391(+)
MLLLLVDKTRKACALLVLFALLAETRRREVMVIRRSIMDAAADSQMLLDSLPCGGECHTPVCAIVVGMVFVNSKRLLSLNTTTSTT